MYPAAYRRRCRPPSSRRKQTGSSRRSTPSPAPRTPGSRWPTGGASLTCAPTTTSASPPIRPSLQAARAALDLWGYGVSSVRFICGTQSLHQELEAALAEFLGTEDAILYSSCFDANGGLFETLLGRRGRHHQRRAQPRQHHRRRTSLQGAAAALPQRRHGGSRGASQGGLRGPRPPDRHRRRLLDGRRHRSPGRDLRSGGALRRHGHGR